MLESDSGRDKWISRLWELPWLKHKWLSQTTPFTWMTVKEVLRAQSWPATSIDTEGRVPLGCAGRLSSSGELRESCITPEQRNRFFLCSTVLYIRNGLRSKLHKTDFQLFLHPFGLDLWIFHTTTKNLVLALWKSICIYRGQCRFAAIVPINVVRAVTSLARQSNLSALLCYLICIRTKQLHKNDHYSWKWENQIMTLLYNNSYRSAVSNAVYLQKILLLLLLREVIRVHFAKFGRKIIFQSHL